MIHHLHPPAKVPDELLELQESVRVLSAVVAELSERIELLETREALARALRPVTDPSG
jgi:hypothetical protein